MNKITKDTLISEALNKSMLNRLIFEKHGLKCVTCSMRDEETIEQGATLHNVDIQLLLNDLNRKH